VSKSSSNKLATSFGKREAALPEGRAERKRPADVIGAAARVNWIARSTAPASPELAVIAAVSIAATISSPVT